MLCWGNNQLILELYLVFLSCFGGLVFCFLHFRTMLHWIPGQHTSLPFCLLDGCSLYWGYRGLATSFTREDQTYKQITLASVQACSSIILDGFPYSIHGGYRKGWPQDMVYRKDTNIQTNLPDKHPLLSPRVVSLAYTLGELYRGLVTSFFYLQERDTNIQTHLSTSHIL